MNSEPSEDQLDRIKAEIREDADAARPRVSLPARAPVVALRDAPSNAAVVSIAQLAQFSGVTFVDQAYRAILRRAPDPSGLEHQMSVLGSGASKIEVIGGLRYSAEGRLCATRVPGLWPRYFLTKLGRVPVLGAILQWVVAVASLPHMLRHQRATEASLAVRFGETTAALQASEQRDAELRETLDVLRDDFERSAKESSDRLARSEAHATALHQYIEAVNANVIELRQLILAMNHWTIEVRKCVDAIDAAETERRERADETAAAMILRRRARDRQRAARMQAWTSAIAQRIPAGAEVLDLCGGSDWLEALGAHGWNVSSIEINTALHRQARERQLNVTLGSPATLLARIADGSLDAITLGSLDRLVEDMPLTELVREAHRILGSGGLLWVEVGADAQSTQDSVADVALDLGFAGAETLDVATGQALMFTRS